MAQTVGVLIANEPGKIVETPYSVHEPINFLIQRIIYKLRLNIEDIYFHRLAINGYHHLDEHKPLLDYSPFGDVLTFKYQIRDQNSLMVKTLTGKIVQVPYSPSSTVLDIKELVQHMEGIPPDQQRLVFQGRQLEDGRTLQEYNIQRKDVVHLILRLRGGGGEFWSVDPIQFADVSDSRNLRKVSFSESAPRGRVASPGTNVECQCTCTPNYFVISNRSFGVIELTKDSFTCPNCHTGNKTTPVTVGFVKCQYRFMGIKDDTGERYTSKWFDAAPEDDYHRFDPGKQARWRRLLIHSRPRDEEDKCVICLGTPLGIKTYSCGHGFHENCYFTVGRRCFICTFDKKLQFPE